MAGRERDHSSKPEVVVDGAERCSATCGDGFRVNIAFPSRPFSPAFLVEQCSSDAVTRGGKFVSPSRVSSTLKGIPPSSCLVASPSCGNSGSSGKRAPVFVESTIFDNSAASGLTGMLSGSASGPFVLPAPKSAGIVEGAGTSGEEEIMLDQQLTKAFETGLRHSLDDPDRDTISDS